MMYKLQLYLATLSTLLLIAAGVVVYFYVTGFYCCLGASMVAFGGVACIDKFTNNAG